MTDQPLCTQGHQFEPRYDKTPVPFKVPGGFGMYSVDVHYKTAYVCDICTRCGERRERA